MTRLELTNKLFRYLKTNNFQDDDYKKINNVNRILYDKLHIKRSDRLRFNIMQQVIQKEYNDPNIIRRCQSRLSYVQQEQLPVPKSICNLFGIPEDTLMTRMEMMKNIYKYIRVNMLTDKNSYKIIHPNEQLCKALNIENTDNLNLSGIRRAIRELCKN
jgi:chromatin remodeling complex protein RSC6